MINENYTNRSRSRCRCRWWQSSSSAHGPPLPTQHQHSPRVGDAWEGEEEWVDGTDETDSQTAGELPGPGEVRWLVFKCEQHKSIPRRIMSHEILNYDVTTIMI